MFMLCGLRISPEVEAKAPDGRPALLSCERVSPYCHVLEV